MVRPDDIVVPFSELAVRARDLIQFVLQAAYQFSDSRDARVDSAFEVDCASLENLLPADVHG